jgi:hypothetical protein
MTDKSFDTNSLVEHNNNTTRLFLP